MGSHTNVPTHSLLHVELQHLHDLLIGIVVRKPEYRPQQSSEQLNAKHNCYYQLPFDYDRYIALPNPGMSEMRSKQQVMKE